MGAFRMLLLAAALACGASACSTWRHVETHERWTLYAKPGERLDADELERSLEPAFRAVEARLGPFEQRVRINAWKADPERERDDPPSLPSEGAERVEDVPGIGRARVRAYHVSGGASPFAATGVFLGTSEVGTVVHELIHARLAEMRTRVPLWFEEGLATLWGDGALYDGVWVVDGLACWPARVLRDEPLTDSELRRVLTLTATEEYSSRDNLLVHFVGWALVFDLAREMPGSDWRGWLAHFREVTQHQGLVQQARDRIARSVGEATIDAWLARLVDPDPGVRFAAAKGMWKLRSRRTIEALIAALPDEADPQVRAAFGLNALLASPELRLPRRTWRELWRKVLPALGEIELGDDREAAALGQFVRGVRERSGRTQAALDDLARFWEE